MNNEFELNINVNDLIFKVTGIEDNGKALVHITCPSNLTYIDYSIFGQLVTGIQTNLSLEFIDDVWVQKINLNEELKEIGNHSFSFTAIKEITIPNNVKTLGNSVFVGCYSLLKVTLNKGLKVIGSNAFTNTAIKEISIPDTVMDINEYAFSGCNQLEEVVVSSSSIVANYNEKEFQSRFGRNAKKVIINAFKFNEDEFKQQRQTISEDIANELGIKLINLVSKEHLNDDDLKLAYDLLIKGANPNMQDSFGNTGLMYMINRKLNDGIDMYLISGCDINVANAMGDTALIEATRLNMVRVVAKLLDMEVHYQHQNINDESALSIAVANQNKEIVTLIEACDEVIKPHPIKSTTSFNLDDIKARARKLGLKNKGV